MRILHFYEKAQHLTVPRNFLEAADQAVHQAGGNAGLPLQRGVTAQLCFETTEADVNFRKEDEEMAEAPIGNRQPGNHPQLFRI